VHAGQAVIVYLRGAAFQPVGHRVVVAAQERGRTLGRAEHLHHVASLEGPRHSIEPFAVAICSLLSRNDPNCRVQLQSQ